MKLPFATDKLRGFIKQWYKSILSITVTVSLLITSAIVVPSVYRKLKTLGDWALNGSVFENNVDRTSEENDSLIDDNSNKSEDDIPQFDNVPEETVPGGKISDYVIVMSDIADKKVKNIGIELQDYLEKISGTEIPFVTDKEEESDCEIIIGDINRKGDAYKADVNKLKYDGYQIKRTGNKILINSLEESGLLIGVYGFLERYFGCGFYAEDCEKVPTTIRMNVPLDTSYITNPSFYARDIGASAVTKNMAPKLGLNAHDWLAKFPETYTYTMGFNAHTWASLVPYDEYKDTHPEYFSMDINGKRTAGEQLCMTNPEVIDLVVERALEWIAGDPESEVISITQNDGYLNCFCPECTAVAEEYGGVYSAPLILMTNKIAEKIEKVYPDIIIDTFAYGWSFAPPEKDIEIRDNVQIRFCSWLSMDKADKWCQMTEHAAYWGYQVNYHSYMMMKPNLYSYKGDDIKYYSLAEEIKYLHDIGVGFIFEQANGSCYDPCFSELRTYLMAKCMWNVDCDPDAVIDEFLENYYGAGWKSLRSYLRNWTAVSTEYAPNYGGPMIHDNFKYNTACKDFFRKSDEWWAEAYELATEEQKTRLDKTSISWLFARNSILYDDEYRSDDMNVAVAYVKSNMNLEKLRKKYGVHIDEQNHETKYNPDTAPSAWINWTS